MSDSTGTVSTGTEPRTKTLDEAVEDYLHRVVRVRPWTKKREEEALEALSGWLHECGGPVLLAYLTPALVSAYVSQAGLLDGEAGEVRAAVQHLLLWAQREGVV